MIWEIVVLLVGGILAATANAPIRFMLRKIDPKAPNQGTLFEAQKELPGGRWIGILERIATYACIVSGFVAGIAMIIAIKGLGRYPELITRDNPKIGELFIIGTFASLLWASAFAAIALAVLELI